MDTVIDTMKTAGKIGRATISRMCVIVQFWLFAGTINWMLARFYANNCAPQGFMGLVRSLLTTESSICRTVFSAQQVAMQSYSLVVLLSLHQFSRLMDDLKNVVREVAVDGAAVRDPEE